MGGNNHSVLIEAPGRINLIGEHTDYNGGYVLPAAIDLKISFVFKKIQTHQSTVSTDIGHTLLIDVNKKIKKSSNHWENYILGVIHEIKKLAKSIHNFSCKITSTLPIGAGISSSSALICGFTKGLAHLNNIDLSNDDIINLSRNVEHNFIGLKGGIMDPFTILNGKKNYVILLNCNSRDYKYINSDFDPYQIVLLNTNKKHNLLLTAYNQRVIECKNALKLIQKKYPEYKFLADIPTSKILELENALHKNEFNRALYVSMENRRTLNSADFLSKGKIEDFGELMYKSHEGLTNKYKVSCEELDFLVDFSKSYDKVIGSRMMGGGFGGCTINLIHKSIVDEYISKICESYYKKFQISLAPIKVSASDGLLLKNI